MPVYAHFSIAFRIQLCSYVASHELLPLVYHRLSRLWHSLQAAFSWLAFRFDRRYGAWVIVPVGHGIPQTDRPRANPLRPFFCLLFCTPPRYLAGCVMQHRAGMVMDRFAAHTPTDDLDIERRREIEAMRLALKMTRDAIIAERILRQKEYAS